MIIMTLLFFASYILCTIIELENEMDQEIAIAKDNLLKADTNLQIKIKLEIINSLLRLYLRSSAILKWSESILYNPNTTDEQKKNAKTEFNKYFYRSYDYKEMFNIINSELEKYKIIDKLYLKFEVFLSLIYYHLDYIEILLNHLHDCQRQKKFLEGNFISENQKDVQKNENQNEDIDMKNSILCAKSNDLSLQLFFKALANNFRIYNKAASLNFACDCLTKDIDEISKMYPTLLTMLDEYIKTLNQKEENQQNFLPIFHDENFITNFSSFLLTLNNEVLHFTYHNISELYEKENEKKNFLVKPFANFLTFLYNTSDQAEMDDSANQVEENLVKLTNEQKKMQLITFSIINEKIREIINLYILLRKRMLISLEEYNLVYPFYKYVEFIYSYTERSIKLN